MRRPHTSPRTIGRSRKKTRPVVMRGAGERTDKAAEKRVRRPLNAFFIWCKEERDSVVRGNPNVNSREIVRLLGLKWNLLPSAEKEPYRLKAEGLRNLHRLSCSLQGPKLQKIGYSGLRQQNVSLTKPGPVNQRVFSHYQSHSSSFFSPSVFSDSSNTSLLTDLCAVGSYDYNAYDIIHSQLISALLNF